MINLRSKKKKEAFLAKRQKDVGKSNDKDLSIDLELQKQVQALDSSVNDYSVGSLLKVLQLLKQDYDDVKIYESLLWYTRKCLTQFAGKKLAEYVESTL